MLKVIVSCVLALVVLGLGARGCGLTPEQIESEAILAGLNAEEGEAFRSANRKLASVIELAGGLQVQVLHLGEGEVPTADDWVVVHFRGKHLDGRVFEDSWRRGEPATIPLDRAIEGWRRALLSLPVGSSVRLVIPPSLAYGRVGAGAVGPEETLVFDLALLAIAEAPAQPERDPAQQAVPGLGPN